MSEGSNAAQIPPDVRRAQAEAYALCRGGWIGFFATREPGRFYLDPRTGFKGKERRAILAAARGLASLARRAGLNPYSLPEYRQEIGKGEDRPR